MKEKQYFKYIDNEEKIKYYNTFVVPRIYGATKDYRFDDDNLTKEEKDEKLKEYTQKQYFVNSDLMDMFINQFQDFSVLRNETLLGILEKYLREENKTLLGLVQFTNKELDKQKYDREQEKVLDFVYTFKSPTYKTYTKGESFNERFKDAVIDFLDRIKTQEILQNRTSNEEQIIKLNYETLKVMNEAQKEQNREKWSNRNTREIEKREERKKLWEKKKDKERSDRLDNLEEEKEEKVERLALSFNPFD
ncbi:hypothetical protein ACWXVT_02200 [Mycoplasma sp. 1573]